MKVGVIGVGYVGLVTAACLAEKGNDVVVYDIDTEKLKRISEGDIPFHEPGLEELVKETIRSRHLGMGKIEDLADSEVFFIAVGTPQGETGIVCIDQVIEAAKSIGDITKGSKDFKVIAVKSTVPPRTTRRLTKILAEYRDEATFAVVSNPEFLKEGAGIEDFRKPDRIIIGTDSIKAETVLGGLYAPFMRTENRLIVTSSESAELIKYASNAMLATRIAFMSELALLAETVGANIDQVREGIGSDSRIGKHFLFPGPGFGGSCFPKDIAGLEEFARTHDINLTILKAVRESNSKQRYWLADTAYKYFNENIYGKNFAVWGAAFKPRTDDIRESPAIHTVARLLDNGAKVKIYDPQPKALESFKTKFNSRVSYSDNIYDTLNDANALLLVTDWDEFKGVDLRKVKDRLREPVIIDGRNLYDLQDMESHGFDYISLGRRKVLARERLNA